MTTATSQTFKNFPRFLTGQCTSIQEGIILTEVNLPVEGGSEVAVRCESGSETVTATCVLDSTFLNLPLCALYGN